MSLKVSYASVGSMEVSAGQEQEVRRDMGPTTQGTAVSESYDSHMNDFPLYKVWYYPCKSNRSVTPGRKLASPAKKYGGTGHQ